MEMVPSKKPIKENIKEASTLKLASVEGKNGRGQDIPKQALKQISLQVRQIIKINRLASRNWPKWLPILPRKIEPTLMGAVI